MSCSCFDLIAFRIQSMFHSLPLFKKVQMAAFASAGRGSLAEAGGRCGWLFGRVFNSATSACSQLSP